MKGEALLVDYCGRQIDLCHALHFFGDCFLPLFHWQRPGGVTGMSSIIRATDRIDRKRPSVQLYP